MINKTTTQQDKRLIRLRDLHHVKSQLRAGDLHSVCEEARCPNRGECFTRGVATFLLNGNICTRGCTFCSIATGKPKPLDPHEPFHVVQAVQKMQLKHVVLTSVNRDDLPDGGAGQYVQTIRALRQALPQITIEVLIPDFKGNLDLVAQVCDEQPEVFNHNIETIPRLYKQVRPGAKYKQSLEVLTHAQKLLPGKIIKSGIMVGHGEQLDELSNVFQDLQHHGVNALTIGQYFQPTTEQLAVVRMYTDDEFTAIEKLAYTLGFKFVWAGRYVRSSYLADACFDEIKLNNILYHSIS